VGKAQRKRLVMGTLEGERIHRESWLRSPMLLSC